MNQKPWITSLCERYKEHVRSRERQIQALSDDYVKFFRYAEWRIEQTGTGVVSLITNNGYLDGHLFIDMRRSLLGTFDNLWVTNLHGNIRTGERTPEGDKDGNVFDIQTGVAVTTLVRSPSKEQEYPVLHYRDFWGNRSEKYQSLRDQAKNGGVWSDIEVGESQYLFLPMTVALKHEWEASRSLLEVFGTGSPRKDAQKAYAAGFVSQQDKFAISFTAADIQSRVKQLLAPGMTESELRKSYRLCTTNQWNFERARLELSQEDLARITTTCVYRPFDIRWTVFHRGVVTILRKELMRHLFNKQNVALLATRGISRQDFAHVFVSDAITDRHAIDNASESMFVFPLYLFPEANLFSVDGASNREPNLAPEFLDGLSDTFGLRFTPDDQGDLENTFGPEDVFYYAYAILHSPAYRGRYEEFLKRDFPRLPLTSDLDLFSVLSQWGEELVALHLMRSPLLDDPFTDFSKSGSNLIGKVKHDTEENRVYINKEGQYFDNVSEETWNFRIGGYQVLDKWLKDRKGRKLSEEDIEHYKKVVKALHETAQVMREIDEVIEAHGGWPLVGSVKQEQETEG